MANIAGGDMAGVRATECGALDQIEMRAVEERAADAYRRRQFDLAAGLYRRLSELEPRRAEHRLHLADALLRLGCRLMAAESFRIAAQLFHGLGLHADAIAACRNALALRPTDAGLHQLLQLLELDGKSEGAPSKRPGSLGESHIHQVTDTEAEQQLLCARPTLKAEQQSPAAKGSGEVC